MPSRLHLRAIAIGLLCCLAALPSATAQKAKLTRVQVEQMIDIHAPDGLIASQIQSRGLNFPVTSKIVESFAAKNSGPKTLAALRDQIRVGKIDIQTEPGAQVIVDGKQAPDADASGSLQLLDIPEGNHELLAKKEGYKNAHASFSLARNEDKQIGLPLEWLGGFLTVSSQPADAEIAVAGQQSFSGSIVDAKCTPGEYTLTVSAHGYLTQTRTVSVSAGEHHAEAFQLAVDPVVIARRLAEAKSKLDAGDSAGAIKLAETVLQQSSTDPSAEAILAEAAFQQGDMNRFVDAGTKAIWGGKPITVSVMHVHAGWRLAIHRVNLTTSQSGIAFSADPPDSHCKIPASLSFDLIRTMSVQRNPVGFIELQLQYASQPRSNFIVHDLGFVVDGSTVGSPANTIAVFGPTMIQSPNSAAQTLQGIAQLIARAKR